MSSTRGIGHPLVFKVGSESSPRSQRNGRAFTTAVRALEGMQKEALVVCAASGTTWRLASDEGPYLNGKDEAPFPLAFFTAGMQFSFLSELLHRARARSVALSSLALEQDNFYSMEGSFLRGDATGGARPAELRLKIESSASAASVEELVRAAERACAVQALMRQALRNTFALTLDGRAVELAELPPSPRPPDADPGGRFQVASPARASFLPDIIVRVRQAEAVAGVEGGAGSSLRPEQKRTLHVHGEARWIANGLMESVVHLVRPIGSSFRFLCDETRGRGGDESAPPPLAYLSAGIGFCFMTQLGRYAQIARQKLEAYRLVQRTVLDGERVEPVDTQVFVDAKTLNEEEASRLVTVGERTCFLHAAMRGEHPSRVHVELNGSELASF